MSIDISLATYPRSYRQFQGSLTPQTWLGCRAENDEMLLPSRELGEGFALFFSFRFFFFLLSELARCLHLVVEGGTAATHPADSCEEESMMGNE